MTARQTASGRSAKGEEKIHIKKSSILFQRKLVKNTRYGAGDEARTRYLHLGKVALYRMSYTRSEREYYTRFCLKCQVLILAR